MPWKNGLGHTEEIEAIQGSYRISAAHINGPCTFSEYFGQKRLLTIWKGSSLLMNTQELKKGQIFAFSGNDKIDCDIKNGNVIDLGIIFDSNKVDVDMKLIKYAKSQSVNLPTHMHYRKISG